MSKMNELSMMVDAICEDRGYDSVREFDYSDVEYLAEDFGVTVSDMCGLLRIEVPENCMPSATC